MGISSFFLVYSLKIMCCLFVRADLIYMYMADFHKPNLHCKCSPFLTMDD